MFNAILMSLGLLALPLIALAAPADSAEAQPMMKKTDLFEGELGGYKLYRIPGVVVTSKGTILAYCEARRDSPADYGEIDNFMRRSTDGGKTWSKPYKVAHMGPRIEGNPSKPVGGEHEQTVDNPVAIPDRDGSVHFLYCVNYERAFYMRSDDDGVTFTAPVEITSTFEKFRPEVAWTVIATGPDHGIQLKSGRLLLPVWISYGPRGKHGPSVNATIYSDDHGKTWQRGEIALPNDGDFKTPNEAQLIELTDGTVMINSRSDSNANRRVIAVSPDGISHWSKPHFDDALWDPICAAGLTNVPGMSGTLVFSNPYNLKRDEDGNPVPGGTAKRRNLSIRVSRDDGKTWISNRTFEEGSAGYSDLAALPDGTILCFYERDVRLTMARFNLAWALTKPSED